MKKRVTMKKVREMAKKYNCEFYKAYGYFYFTGKNFFENGVYTAHLNALTLDQWEMELLDKIKEL